MAYQGNVPAEAYTTTAKDTFNGNGSTTAFTLSLPTVTNDIRVVVENVVQEPTAAYSVSGTTLTFTAAPPSGTNNVYVVHLGPAVQTAIPPSEIAGATVFASNVTVQGAFTSLGIDDNATSTAMTLDSSGNLLVGTTSFTGTSGVSLSATGYVYASSTNDVAIYANRETSDGDIAVFRKDGTTVGSIGAANGNLYLGQGDTTIMFSASADAVLPKGTDGADRDGFINLGQNINRFKDLYLSGGVYLGGTGSANYLDDYEEGYHEVTLTPSNGGSITLSATQRYLSYTKIGNRVFVTGKVDISSVSSPLGHVKISLPFAIDNTSPAGTNDSRRTAGSIWITNSSINITQFVLYGIENESAMRIYVGDGTQNQDTTGQKLSSSHGVAFTFNYRTA
jgi:hypothetical protein